VTITIAPNRFACRLHYVIGLHGSQCAFLRRTDMVTMTGDRHIEERKWETLRWFNPDSAPKFDEFEPFVKADLCKAIRELGEMVKKTAE